MIPRNLTSFANKPQSIRSMRWTDGLLLEGDGDQRGEVFWACIAKPIFFMWTSDKQPNDENLRRLSCTAASRIRLRHKPTYEQNNAHFAQYLPLCAQFKRRVLLLRARPDAHAAGSRGKLYTLPGEDYIAGIMPEFLARTTRRITPRRRTPSSAWPAAPMSARPA